MELASSRRKRSGGGNGGDGRLVGDGSSVVSGWSLGKPAVNGWLLGPGKTGRGEEALVRLR